MVAVHYDGGCFVGVIEKCLDAGIVEMHSPWDVCLLIGGRISHVHKSGGLVFEEALRFSDVDFRDIHQGLDQAGSPPTLWRYDTGCKEG